MKAGDRVRHSGYVINRLRDRWNTAGGHNEKRAAKDYLDAKSAERGTVTGISKGRFTAEIVAVDWDNGQQCTCLPYLLEVVS